ENLINSNAPRTAYSAQTIQTPCFLQMALLYDRGCDQKREDCCGMAGALPIDGTAACKACQRASTSSGAWAISGVCKNRYGVVVCSHFARVCSQTANSAWFCGILSLPINRTMGLWAVSTACTGTFGFLRWASIIASLCGTAA